MSDREILFRGKCKYNGEWVEGYYAVLGVRHVIIVKQSEAFYTLDGEGHVNEIIEVIPETVGWYTGSPDENGTKIFEGDIVKVLDSFCGEVVFEAGAFGIGVRPVIDYDYLANKIAEVTGCNNRPHFCYNDNFLSLWELYWNYNQEDDCCSVVEVIGNIHDNLDLLKGE